MYVIGLMSGTSADGVDAVLARFSGNSRTPKWELINFLYQEYPSKLKDNIIKAGQNYRFTSREFLEMSEAITHIYCDIIKACDSSNQASLVACHGQTLWHRPPENTKKGASLQTLQAPLLAVLTNRSIIYDFRAADLSLGGQGAPLFPLLDEALLGRVNGWRAVLNLGGIANLSLIPPKCGKDRFRDVLGWDCGPANSLIDLAVQKITNNKMQFDKDGLMAYKGKVNAFIIENCLKQKYFHDLPPKSTGRDKYGVEYLNENFSELSELCDEDLIATLTTFTASLIASDMDKLKDLSLPLPIELLLAGGGSRNPFLFDKIASFNKGIRVRSIDDLGVPFNAREALGFALLGWWHVRHYKPDYKSITGAKRPSLLGIRVNPT